MANIFDDDDILNTIINDPVSSSRGQDQNGNNMNRRTTTNVNGWQNKNYDGQGDIDFKNLKIQSRTPVVKKKEDGDDLLDLIADIEKNQNNVRASSREREKSKTMVPKGFLDEDFLDDDNDINNKVTLDENAQSRRANLFGLAKQQHKQQNSDNSRSIIEDQESRKNKDQENIPVINLAGVSRRGNSKNVTPVNIRPNTSPLPQDQPDEIDEMAQTDFPRVSRTKMKPPLNKRQENSFNKDPIKIERSNQNETIEKMDSIDNQFVLKQSSNSPKFQQIENVFGMKQQNILDALADRKEDDFKNHLEQIKKFYQDQIESLKLNYKQEIQHEKTMRQQIQDECKQTIQKENAKQKELHQFQINQIQENHNLQINQQRRQYEIEIESLKRQIEQQLKYQTLAEDLQKQNQQILKLNNEQTFKINNSSEHNAKDHELALEKSGLIFVREKQVQEQERKLELEKQLIEKEKEKLEKRREDQELKEMSIRNEILDEKQHFKSEYQRLSDLQEKLKEYEIEKRKDLQIEKENILNLQKQIQIQQDQFKDEYTIKYIQYEKNVQILENDRQEFSRNQQQNENLYMQKLKELEEQRTKVNQMEIETFKIKRNIDSQHYDVQRLSEELNLQVQNIKTERESLQKEAAKIQQIARDVKQESESIQHFKENFENEKSKIELQKFELDQIQFQVQKDKTIIKQNKIELEKKAQVINSLRNDFVKKIDQNPDFFQKEQARAFQVQQTIQNMQMQPLQQSNQVISTNRTETAVPLGYYQQSLNKPQVNIKKDVGITNFLQQLKILEQNQSDVQKYLTQEKEGILHRKIQLEDQYYNNLRSLNDSQKSIV